MAETVAPTPDRMFVEIRYKSLYMETYMVKQTISPPIKLFTLAEIFICKQRNNKILTWYGRRNDTFCANRPLTGVTTTFIRCLYHVTGVSIGQGGTCLLVDSSLFDPQGFVAVFLLFTTFHNIYDYTIKSAINNKIEI